jgi:hypothetical protein
MAEAVNRLAIYSADSGGSLIGIEQGHASPAIRALPDDDSFIEESGQASGSFYALAFGNKKPAARALAHRPFLAQRFSMLSGEVEEQGLRAALGAYTEHPPSEVGGAGTGVVLDDEFKGYNSTSWATEDSKTVNIVRVAIRPQLLSGKRFQV